MRSLSTRWAVALTVATGLALHLAATKAYIPRLIDIAITQERRAIAAEQDSKLVNLKLRRCEGTASNYQQMYFDTRRKALGFKK